MILILGEEEDYSTSLIEDWLIFYDVKYIRVNVEDYIKSIFVKIDGNSIELEMHTRGSKINLKDITKVFVRRSFLQYKYSDTTVDIGKESINIKEHLFNEFNEFASFFYTVLIDKTIVFGNNTNINKLSVLFYANKIGLKTPLTIIADKKQNLSSEKKYITKAIKDSIDLIDNNKQYYNYTSLLDIDNVKKVFFPSLIQEAINTLIEIRVFLFADKTFSMAIFSKNKDKDILDYRDYDNSNNNYVPYKLPRNIIQKLKKLSKKFDLNTCSFDLILDTNLKYYLLEINTEGQFNWLSYECNYNIEKEIAKTIINYG